VVKEVVVEDWIIEEAEKEIFAPKEGESLPRIGLEPYPTLDGRPIPPWEPVSGVLVTRLRSSRRGVGSWWTAGELAAKALNDALYEPVLRAQVEEFRWYLPGELGHPGEVARDEVFQGGTAVTNWWARGVWPLPDPLRDLLARLSREGDFCETEGGFRVWHFLPDDVVEELGPLTPPARWRSGCVRREGVYFYPVSAFAYRVIGGQVVCVAATSGRAAVTCARREPVVIGPGWALVCFQGRED
jgi:hypothetical protein